MSHHELPQLLCNRNIIFNSVSMTSHGIGKTAPPLQTGTTQLMQSTYPYGIIKKVHWVIIYLSSYSHIDIDVTRNLKEEITTVMANRMTIPLQ